MKRTRYNQKRKRKDSGAKTGSRFKQGYYKPVNQDKFKPSPDKTMNSGPFPFYRSSWELKVYKWADLNENIKFWGTESIAIPYVSPKDNKIHRYFPDVFIQFLDGTKTIIEIKPKKQVNLPINTAKFEAAREYSKQINAEFIIMTEQELK